MLGAIIGDIVGSTFELENNRSQFFEFFRKNGHFTDDSILIISTISLLINSESIIIDEHDKNTLIEQLNNYKIYEDEHFPLISPELSLMEIKAFSYSFYNSGYNTYFQMWLENGSSKPYYSYGNGGLVRLVPIALWGYKKGWSKLKTINTGLAINNITHNHPLAQKMAELYVGLLYELCSTKSLSDFEKIKICNNYAKQYDLDTSCTRQFYLINQDYNCNSKTSLELVLNCLRESNGFESYISNIVSCGGDTDTYCALGGAIGEIIWGIPDDMKNKVRTNFQGYSSNLLKYIDKYYESIS